MSADLCAPWATVDDLCAPCDGYTFDADLMAGALRTASRILWNLTGRQWPGVCTTVARPCAHDRVPASYRLPGGTWPWWNHAHLAAPGTCSGSCGLSEVVLPGYPVASVEQVLIDGEVLASARYRLDERRRLVYLPESASAERQGWPCCQQLDLADTEPDTWSVTYSYGQAPPTGGVEAAASLACQLALACRPELASTGCRLPKRVTSVARQGTTVTVLDSLELWNEGRTGLPEVDLWLASEQIGPGRRGAAVIVPDRARRARLLGAPPGS